MSGTVVRKHVAGLMLEAAIKEEPYSKARANILVQAAAVLERGPVVDIRYPAAALYHSAVSNAEPFIARAVQDLIGGWNENGERIVREALVQP